jgi:SAM-dependent methyltransferase
MSQLTSHNQTLYDHIWKATKIRPPHHYPEWLILQPLIKSHHQNLELGCGLRPKLPFKNTVFIDISQQAINQLREQGAQALKTSLKTLPFPNQNFHLICAFDVLEHISPDQTLLIEISRVLKKSGKFVFSVPLHQHLFDGFDKTCGHVRRYQPTELKHKLSTAGLKMTAISRHGLRPNNQLSNAIAAFFLRHRPFLSAKICDLFYRPSLQLAKRRLKLENNRLLQKLNRMSAALVLCQKI